MAGKVARAGGTRPWAGLIYGVVTAVIVAAGGFTFWYRATYNVMPGQGASGRVHWCGRDYQSAGGSPQTWRQISARQRPPLRAVGRYPPLGLPGQELLAVPRPGPSDWRPAHRCPAPWSFTCAPGQASTSPTGSRAVRDRSGFKIAQDGQHPAVIGVRGRARRRC